VQTNKQITKQSHYRPTTTMPATANGLYVCQCSRLQE